MSEGIGDINSAARGSGARYNANKPALELIPLELIARCMVSVDKPGPLPNILSMLGEFQMRHFGANLRSDIQIIDNLITAVATHYGTQVWLYCAKVFDYGRTKYAEWNWLKGMPFSAVIGSAARHCFALFTEVTDSESGLPHVGHLMCNLVMLRTYLTEYPEGDDRPRPASAHTTGDC